MPISEAERRIIRVLQGDFPIVPKPYEIMAERAGAGEEELLECLRGWKESGVVRRVGAILAHRKAGMTANAMSVWEVEEEDADTLGHILASMPEVSHAYHRPPAEGWPYRVYGMIHGREEGTCEIVAGRVRDEAERRGIRTSFRLLYSKREFKKKSLSYF